MIRLPFGFATVTSPGFDSLAQLVPQAAMLRMWVLGAARVLPSVILVPAFGLSALPMGARLGLALTMGLSVAPALSQSDELPLGLAVTLQALRGTPVALSAAAALWAASMAGGLVDELRRSRETSHLPVVPAGTSPMGALFAMVAAIAFLETGGTARIVTALSRDPEHVQSLLTHVVQNLLSGVQVAIAIAVPFLVASVFFEIATSLMSRAVHAASLQSLWAPLRSLFFLVLLAAMLDRILALIVIVAARAG